MGLVVQWLSYIFFFASALLHIAFFIFESFLWGKPHINKRFGVSAEQAAASKLMAFNQGFYNLFLAIGVFIGLYLISQKEIMLAGAMVSFSGASMVGAGLVLFFSAPHLRRAAWIQMGPPLLGFVFLTLHILEKMGMIFN